MSGVDLSAKLLRPRTGRTPANHEGIAESVARCYILHIAQIEDLQVV